MISFTHSISPRAGFLSALSSLSRATYIFHTLPYLIVLFKKRLAISLVRKRIKLAILLGWLCLLAVSLVSVMVLRYSDISPIDASSNKVLAVTGASFSHEVFVGIITKRVSALVVDRWIGLEGVMATTSYPEKNIELFTDALLERRVRGKVDLYTKIISRAGVTDSDVEKFQYATIPGAVAFFYYAGSLWGGLAGMVCLTSLMLFSERAVLFLTRNPYLCAFWSISVAQTVASFGLGLGQAATYYAVCFVAMALIWFGQILSPAEKI